MNIVVVNGELGTHSCCLGAMYIPIGIFAIVLLKIEPSRLRNALRAPLQLILSITRYRKGRMLPLCPCSLP